MRSDISAVALAGALAALLFFLSFWKPGAMPRRRHHHAAMAGSVILAGAAIYGMDVINLPEIIAALVIGAAIGLLLGRELPRGRLPMLMTMLAGLAGGATICAVIAAWLNPYAFGLVDEGSEAVAARHALLMALAVLTGGTACAGAISTLASPRRGGTTWVALTAGMAGWSAAAMAFLLENMGMAVAGGLAGAAGTLLAARLCAGARPNGLADAKRRP